MTETPSTLGFRVVRNIPNAIYVMDEEQKLYKGDKETPISVKGYVVYFMNVPVYWRSMDRKL